MRQEATTPSSSTCNWRESSASEFPCRLVIDTSYTRDFNPFTEYIGKLKPWDGVTDYIGRLADTGQAEDQEVLEEKFEEVVRGNAGPPIAGMQTASHLVIILYSEQGKRKEHMDKKAAVRRSTE